MGWDARAEAFSKMVGSSPGRLRAHGAAPRCSPSSLFLSFLFLYISAWIPTHRNHGVCSHSAFSFFLLLRTMRGNDTGHSSPMGRVLKVGRHGRPWPFNSLPLSSRGTKQNSASAWSWSWSCWVGIGMVRHTRSRHWAAFIWRYPHRLFSSLLLWAEGWWMGCSGGRFCPRLGLIVFWLPAWVVAWQVGSEEGTPCF